jgi:hypothetical protein
MKTFSILFHILLLIATTDLFAAEKEEAKKAFTRGTALYKENRFAEAADEFRKAQRLRPSWKILYNIGQCSAAAKQYGLALEAFEAYLSQGGDEVPKEKRTSVIEEIRILREMVGYLTLDAPAGADVVVDGYVRGATPLPGPMAVGTGVTHSLVVRQGDTQIFSKDVRVNSGNTLHIETQPDETTAPPPPASRTDPGPSIKPDQPHVDTAKKHNYIPLRMAGWVTTGLGVGALVAMAVTGYKTAELNKETDDNDRDKVNTYQKTTNALLGVGATLTVAGATMVIVSYVSEKRHRKGEKRSASLMFAPSIMPNGALIAVSRSF